MEFLFCFFLVCSWGLAWVTISVLAIRLVAKGLLFVFFFLHGGTEDILTYARIRVNVWCDQSDYTNGCNLGESDSTLIRRRAMHIYIYLAQLNLKKLFFSRHKGLTPLCIAAMPPLKSSHPLPVPSPSPGIKNPASPIILENTSCLGNFSMLSTRY